MFSFSQVFLFCLVELTTKEYYSFSERAAHTQQWNHTITLVDQKTVIECQQKQLESVKTTVKTQDGN